MNSDFDSDAITCPYCGYKEYPEVGFHLPHQCEGTKQAAIEREKERQEYIKQEQAYNQKVIEQARFLTSSGLFTLPEAIENIQVGGFLEEDDDETQCW